MVSEVSISITERQRHVLRHQLRVHHQTISSSVSRIRTRDIPLVRDTLPSIHIISSVVIIRARLARHTGASLQLPVSERQGLEDEEERETSVSRHSQS